MVTSEPTREDIAHAAAVHQLSRPFAEGLRRTLTRPQLDAIHALVRSGAVEAIDAWERGRAARASADFYQRCASRKTDDG